MSVSFSECSAEMAVARKAEIEAQSGQIVILGKKVQSPRQSQAQLITIERHALDLLKDLGEIDRRTSHFRSDFGQCPASSQIACQDKLDPVNQPLPPEARARFMRGARPQRTADQG